MNVEDWKGKHGPVLTCASSPAISFHGYSPCDYVVEIGVVIIHPDSEKVLIFEESDAPYRLPTRKVSQDMASALRHPLDRFQEEMGYNIERVALRKFVKHLQGIESTSYYDLDAATILLGEKSTRAFHFTLDLRWVRDDEGSFSHPKEVVTFWFAGLITNKPAPDLVPRSSDGASSIGRLVDLKKADELLSLDREYNYSQLQALHIFSTLWQHQSSPDGVLDLEDRP